jgi:hypothetical protein
MMKTTMALAFVAAALGGCASLDYDDGYHRFGYYSDGYYRGHGDRYYGDRYYYRDRYARDRYYWHDDDRDAYYRYRGDVYYRPYYGSLTFRDHGQ